MGKKYGENKGWKAGIGLLAAVIALAVSGCSGNYEAKNAGDVKSIALDAMYDEQNGYHVGGLTWDLDKKGVEDAIQASLGNASQGLEKTYYLENDDVEKIDDYVASSVDYAFSPEGTLVNVTCNFHMDDYTTEELDALYEYVKGVFTDNYGERDSEGESETKQGKITFYTKSCKWEKKLPDGRISSLQVAKADTGTSTEVVSVGAVVYTEEGRE